MKQTKSAFELNYQIKIALLGTIAFLLMFIEFPILPAAPFLKLDFSDLPALIGAFALGPVAGVVIELLKNILHAIVKGSDTMLVGELANFTIGAVWIVTAALIYRHKKTRVNAIIALVTGTIIFTIFAMLMNFYVFIPLYQHVAPVLDGNTVKYLVTIIAPFNLIKGAVVSVITLALYKTVSPLIHREALLEESKKFARD